MELRVGDLSQVEPRTPLVEMEQYATGGVVVEQAMDKPFALGRFRVCGDAVSDCHGFEATSCLPAEGHVVIGRAKRMVDVVDYVVDVLETDR